MDESFVTIESKALSAVAIMLMELLAVAMALVTADWSASTREPRTPVAVLAEALVTSTSDNKLFVVLLSFVKVRLRALRVAIAVRPYDETRIDTSCWFELRPSESAAIG